MKIEEICHEIKTINPLHTSPIEKIAIQEAISILKRCEKYRKALLKINNTNDQEKITRIIEETFDCEES